MTGILRSALRAKWLRGALIALLLAAQHGALTHALTHALMHAGRLAHVQSAVYASAQVPGHGHDSRPKQATESCAFDLVYSQVLGGVHAGHAAAFETVEHVLVVATVLAVRDSVTVVPYDSRGPPVIS